MLRSIFAATVLLTCSSALAAQVQAPDASQQQQQQAKPKKPRLICQEDEMTGSRLQSHRVCMTAEQWKQQQQQDQDVVSTAQRKNGSAGNNH